MFTSFDSLFFVSLVSVAMVTFVANKKSCKQFNICLTGENQPCRVEEIYHVPTLRTVPSNLDHRTAAENWCLRLVKRKNENVNIRKKLKIYKRLKELRLWWTWICSWFSSWTGFISFEKVSLLKLITNIVYRHKLISSLSRHNLYFTVNYVVWTLECSNPEI